MKNNVKNQGVSSTPVYIIIRIDWDNKLIMPVEDGLNFIRSWASATTLNTRDDPPTISEKSKDFQIEFMTEQGFKEIQMASVLDNAPQDKE